MTNQIFASLALAGLISVSSAAIADEDKTVTVFKTPWCGCCKVWTDAVENAGYHVLVKDMEDLSDIKKQAGIPEDMEACHTAVIGGDRKYIVEGHVPLEAIDKMMSERPDIRGIVAPGMPQGSLGMGNDPDAKYTVFSLSLKSSDEPQPYMKTGQ
ncbi:Protein of unknown function, DUF [Roseibium album]|nr:Protein of unknown function, DUF [Roseibium album]